MSVIIDTTMSEVKSVIKYARYGANNCMIGNGWEIKELVRCEDCKFNNRCMLQGFVRDNAVIPITDDWFCADGKRKEQNDG